MASIAHSVPSVSPPRFECRVCGCLTAIDPRFPCAPCDLDMERERQRQRTLEWRAELADAHTEAVVRFGGLPDDENAVEGDR